MTRAEGVLITVIWSAVVAFIAYKIADMLVGLRVPEDEARGPGHHRARRDGLPPISFLPARLIRASRKLRAPVLLGERRDFLSTFLARSSRPS
ncbi:MAG: hypothetical protein M9884_06570 [Rhodocyclaceae bacterium]|nr:hypothetical protein [Rhodocyclaceae bacterium]